MGSSALTTQQPIRVGSAAAGYKATTNSTPTNPTNSQKEPLLVNTIYASGEVTRMHWFHHNGDGKLNYLSEVHCVKPLIETEGSSSSTSTSSTSGLLATVCAGHGQDCDGKVAVWNLVNQYIPVCTLTGQKNDTFVDFAYLGENNRNYIATKTSFKSSKSSTNDVGNTNTSVTTNTTIKNNITASTATNVLIGSVVTISREGRVLIQDLSKAWYPLQHVSPNIITVSSKGHVAFHRGTIYDVSDRHM